jgi:hypothetical protein
MSVPTWASLWTGDGLWLAISPARFTEHPSIFDPAELFRGQRFRLCRHIRCSYRMAMFLYCFHSKSKKAGPEAPPRHGSTTERAFTALHHRLQLTMRQPQGVEALGEMNKPRAVAQSVSPSYRAPSTNALRPSTRTTWAEYRSSRCNGAGAR